MSRRRIAFELAARELLQAGLEGEAVALRRVQAADVESTDGVDWMLAGFRSIADRVRARRAEADGLRVVTEQTSAAFELRCYARVRVAALTACECRLRAVERNLLRGGAV